VVVKVGSVPHPMEEKHHIEWIEIQADGKAYRQFLEPGEPAEAVFDVKAPDIKARECCNIHGLWRS
ncbi:MAG: desulfoferrodoxin family protein, partial [Synergistota bacterium]|nr:desulfoferrodoxin family protein [Synergistota bacterium]